MIEHIPPHDEAAEQQLLSAALQSKKAMAAIVGVGLAPEDFYHPAHDTIWRAALDLTRAGKPVDTIMVRDRLGDAGELDAVGGWPYLCDLMTAMVIPGVAKHYAEIVIEKARRRAAVYACHDSLADLYDPASTDPVSLAQGRLMGIKDRTSAESTVDFVSAVEEAYDPILKRIEDPNASTPRAFKTGLYDLDNVAWVEPGEYVVLGARPSDGKTALALQVMLEVAAGKRVLFHSLEMPRRTIAMRYLATLAGVSSHRLRTGYLSSEEQAAIKGAYAAANGLQMRIDDRPGLTVAQIVASARREQQNGKLGLLVVDHLLKVRPADARASRHQQMAQISNDLAVFGKESGVAVMGLYQLNRASANEQRKPRLSDLRESGSAEEDADHVWLLHRPDHLKAFSPAELLVEKNRNGPCGLVNLMFQSALTRFECATHQEEATA